MKFFSNDDRVIRRHVANELLTPYFNDFNGDGGFGMPFEMYYFDNLWLMTKGGSLPGFYSLSVFVKELKLGFTIGTSPKYNGPQFLLENVTLGAVNILVNAVKLMVSQGQQREVYPPPQDGVVQQYTGCYNLTSEFVSEWMVLVEDDSNGEFKLLTENPPSPVSLYFRGQTGGVYTFQIGMTPELPCINTEVGALEGQYLQLEMVGSVRAINLSSMSGEGTYAFQGPCPPMAQPKVY